MVWKNGFIEKEGISKCHLVLRDKFFKILLDSSSTRITKNKPTNLLELSKIFATLANLNNARCR